MTVSTIRLRRGASGDRPAALAGEPLVDTDAPYKVHVGSGGGNVEIARWGAKKTVASITVVTGTETGTVADLQTAHDGNFHLVTEVAADNGIEVIGDFTDVAGFTRVKILALYRGSNTHAVAIQLYNWITTTWDTFDAMQYAGKYDVTTAGAYCVNNHSFTVMDDANYIGTGADVGKVRVRFMHTPNANAGHELYTDVVALY